MMALVHARKRKDAHNPRWPSHDKGKVRLIEHSGQDLLGASTKTTRARNSISASGAFTNLRKGSIKIFSIFRSGKSKCTVLRHLVMD
jgi:hypothetical protein